MTVVDRCWGEQLTRLSVISGYGGLVPAARRGLFGPRTKGTGLHLYESGEGSPGGDWLKGRKTRLAY